VRISDHAIISTGAAALLFPLLRRKTLVPWAASILIDVDHYLWFCAHERSANPLRAMRFFNQAQPPQHSATRLLHHPGVLLVMLALSSRWRWLRLVLLGMVFHAGVDVYHGIRMEEARRNALLRDHETCQRCGAQGGGIVAHLNRQPLVLPSYRAEHLISVCGACHELAHAQGTRFIRELADSSPEMQVRSYRG
jgi:hypothetical protein